MSTNENTTPTTIKMVENALFVLDILHDSAEPLGVNEIAKKCSLSVSTAFRILKTLGKAGWAFQLSDDRYITGRKISFVTEKTNLYFALSDVAYFVMQDYVTRYNRAMNLMVRENDSCKILQQARTKSLVDNIPPLFSKIPIYACACGKVLLSETPLNIAEQVIRSCQMVPLTEYTVTDPDIFWKNLRPTAMRSNIKSLPRTEAVLPCLCGMIREISLLRFLSADLSAYRIPMGFCRNICYR